MNMQTHPLERLHVESTAASARPSHGARLVVDGVTKSFGDREVLKQLSIGLQAGEFVAIVGRSGCGKSTLLRLVAGLDAADTGNISTDGRAASGLNPDVRIMFQEPRLLPWKSVFDNAALGLEKRWHRKVVEVLEQVGLSDRGGDWPAVLSGGQRQRVALARALVHEPRLLLLDEPLGALDALTRIEMHSLIERLWREHGFTALLVTHDVGEAVALADRVVVIDNGVIALDVRIDLPRPRERGSAAFAALEDRILRVVLGVPSASVGAVDTPRRGLKAV
jgi:sulfonate transport system ATP-binding protein